MLRVCLEFIKVSYDYHLHFLDAVKYWTEHSWAPDLALNQNMLVLRDLSRPLIGRWPPCWPLIGWHCPRPGHRDIIVSPSLCLRSWGRSEIDAEYLHFTVFLPRSNKSNIMMMLKIIVGNTRPAFNFNFSIIRVGVMSRVFPSCCDQKLCPVWPASVLIRTSNTTQYIRTDHTVIFRGKSGNIECLSYESVVVSPVKILIFVCEAFYPGKERTPGLSHGCHGHSVCRPQQRGTSHYTDSKDWASASCRSRFDWEGFTRSESQRQWSAIPSSLTSCLSPILLRWVCFEFIHA